MYVVNPMVAGAKAERGGGEEKGRRRWMQAETGSGEIARFAGSQHLQLEDEGGDGPVSLLIREDVEVGRG